MKHILQVNSIILDHIKKHRLKGESKLQTLQRLLNIKVVENEDDSKSLFNLKELEASRQSYKPTKLIASDLMKFNPKVSLGEFISYINDPMFIKRSANRKYLLILYFLYYYDTDNFIAASKQSILTKRIHISDNLDEINNAGNSIIVDPIGDSGYYAVTNLAIKLKVSVIDDLMFSMGIEEKNRNLILYQLSFKTQDLIA